MTTFLLVRHGDTDAVGKTIVGDQPGWGLNQMGRTQVANLADRLSRRPLQAVYTSPLQRAVETAEPIARKHRLKPLAQEELGEVKFGAWEGKTIQMLDAEPDWRLFNVSRSTVRPPGGELMIETQARMVAKLESLCARHPDQTVAVVSHADPLRCVIAHYLAIPIDMILRFEISPASVTVVERAKWGTRILCVNGTGDIPA
jgi:broad specificity phosphatase PhoE